MTAVSREKRLPPVGVNRFALVRDMTTDADHCTKNQIPKEIKQ
jgi:hypothetical protein